jgi:hypothetical protein
MKEGKEKTDIRYIATERPKTTPAPQNIKKNIIYSDCNCNENEKLMQGNGFVYVVCKKCGKKI